ncbi:MAG: sulfotransferase [Gemmatimonadota bacterium]|nr:MAG: sulfotransferase [Gemmatimonadota bacterium]
MKRIHVVGSGPRSGTTLMVELLVNGFEIDGYPEHEMGIFKRPRGDYGIFLSKRPRDVETVRPLLAVDPDLWVIYMLRDPRDVVVSRHKGADGMYYATLHMWKISHAYARKAANHPRFLTVRFEDLVREPERIQRRLMTEMPFLKKRAEFADFDQVARPSEKSRRALGGVRALSSSRVGAWRDHKPRLAAQLELHGPVTDELVELGYEKDGSWLLELEGVVPAHYESYWPDRFSLRKRLRRKYGVLRSTALYTARVTARRMMAGGGA